MKHRIVGIFGKFVLVLSISLVSLPATARAGGGDETDDWMWCDEHCRDLGDGPFQYPGCWGCFTPRHLLCDLDGHGTLSIQEPGFDGTRSAKDGSWKAAPNTPSCDLTVSGAYFPSAVSKVSLRAIAKTPGSPACARFPASGMALSLKPEEHLSNARTLIRIYGMAEAGGACELHYSP